MKTNNYPLWLRALAVLSLLALVCTFLIHLYNIYQVMTFTQWLKQPESRAIWVFYGYLFSFFAHVVILVTVVVAILKTQIKRRFARVAVITGVVSMITLFWDWGCMLDISREAPLGWEVNREQFALYAGFILHMLFIAAGVVFIKAFKGKKSPRASTYPGENLFISMNSVGLVSGAAGLAVVLLEWSMGLDPQGRKWFVLPWIIAATLPYLIILTVWLLSVRFSRGSGVYDEKQAADLRHAGLTTWLITLPLMLAIFMIQSFDIYGSLCILWLPLYLFTSLLLFSASSLYYYKHA